MKKMNDLFLLKKMTTLTLVATDGQKFELESELAKMSTVLNDLMEVVTDSDQEIALGDQENNFVHAPDLAHIIDFLKAYKTNFMSLSVDEQNALIDQSYEKLYQAEWLQPFLDKDIQKITDLLLVSNYLDIKILTELLCKRFVSFISHKTPEQLREMFGISEA